MLVQDTLTGYFHDVPEYRLRAAPELGEYDDGGLGLPFLAALPAIASVAGSILPGLLGGGHGGGGGAAPAAAVGGGGGGGVMPQFVPIPTPQVVPLPIPIPFPAIRVPYPVPMPVRPNGVTPGPFGPTLLPGPAAARHRVRTRRRR